MFRIKRKDKMKIYDRLYALAAIGIFYIIGVVGGMSEFNMPIGAGLVRCAVTLYIVYVLVSTGLKFERAKH